MRKLVIASVLASTQLLALKVAASDSTDVKLLVHQEQLSDSEVLVSFRRWSHRV
jgi:hypothetical protein